jgi:tetratricopeptide (TPR) repeat protein
MNMEHLEEMALKLELQQATGHLIAYLTDSTIEIENAPGRYNYFSELLKERPVLSQALVDDDQSRIQGEWSKVQAAYQTDMRFLHALTIVYWEAALAKLAQQQAAEKEWLIATGMWIMLLSYDAFWDYFSQDRWTDKHGERVVLGVKNQEELRQDIVNDILTLHSTTAKQFFAAGQYDQARIHIRCLDMCREKSKQFFSSLRQYGVPFITDLNDRTLEWISTQAFKMLDEWCVALVADAEKETNDAEAIKKLPKGVRLNYSDGVRMLQQFIVLRIPIVRVLCASLGWYNDWCYDVYVLKDTQQLQQLVQAAREVADQLIPLSEKGKGYTQENKLLSKHFLLRGFVQDDPAQAVKQYEEALAWDPTNQNAQELCEQANVSLYIEPALEYAKNNEFDKAHQVLDEAERHLKDPEPIQRMRAAVYFAQGQVLAEEGKYREALVCAQRAYECDSEEEAVQALLQQMQELAPEEDNVRIISVAEKAFKDERFDQAIKEASRITKTSKLFDRACTILSVAHLGRGMGALKNKNPESAEGDLRKALEFYNGDDDEARYAIKQLLSVAINARAVRMIEDAPSYSRADTARKARKLLEEALSIDPKNSTARENLNMVRSIV